MDITWLGHSCFLISTDEGSLVTDPYDSRIGLSLPKNLSADVVTISHHHYDHDHIEAVRGNPCIVDGPGIHRCHGWTFQGLETYHDEYRGAERGSNTVYLFEIDGIRLAHLGDLGHILPGDMAVALSDVDVLMVPIGGTYTINGTQALTVVNQINPRLVLPMHYAVPGLSLKNEIDGADVFLAMLKRPVIAADRLTIDKGRLKTLPPSAVIFSG